ncbi:MAG TPA: N-6 DNA methylase, partial [Ktedonobacteraceae bacterium]
MAVLQFQREIQEGFITLLQFAGLMENEELPYKVITTAPSQWLPFCSLSRTTILDVSGMFGSTDWRIKADVKDRLVREIQASGWSDQQIISNTQLSATFSHVSGSEARKLQDRVEFILFGDSQQPVAIIGLHTHDAPFEALSKELRFTALILNVPFAIFTNGNQLSLTNMLSQSTQILKMFPSPNDLGLESISTPDQLNSALDRNLINYCDTSSSLIESLENLEKTVIIIDYTLPWGDWKTEKTSRIRDMLPEQFKDTKAIDSYIALLLLINKHLLSNRLVCVVPGGFTQVSALSQIRSYLASNMQLKGVIELPSDLYSTTSMPSSILILDTQRGHSSKKTAFLSLPNRGDIIRIKDQSWYSSLTTGLQEKPMKLGFQAEVKTSDLWTVAQHQPESHAIEEHITKITTTQTIGELFNIFLGLRRASQIEASSEGIPVIHAQNLSSQKLAIDDLEKFRIISPIPEQYKVRQG